MAAHELVSWQSMLQVWLLTHVVLQVSAPWQERPQVAALPVHVGVQVPLQFALDVQTPAAEQVWFVPQLTPLFTDSTMQRSVASLQLCTTQTLSGHGLPVPTQLPLLQVSRAVQNRLSSQAVPSSAGVLTQPAVGSHVAFRHVAVTWSRQLTVVATAPCSSQVSHRSPAQA